MAGTLVYQDKKRLTLIVVGEGSVGSVWGDRGGWQQR